MRLALLGFWLALSASVRVAGAEDSVCLAAHEQAQVLRSHGQLMAARSALLSCTQSNCPAPVSADCVAWLDEVEHSLPSVVFAVTGVAGQDLAEAHVSAGERELTTRTDGHALALDPGAYRLRVEVSGYQPAELPLTIREAEKNRIVRVQLIPVPPPSAADSPAPPRRALAPASPGVPVGTYVLGGTALAALAVGVTFAVVGNHTYAQLQDRCSPDCSADQVAKGKREYLAADVGFGVAAAGAALAVVAFVTGRADVPVQAAILRDGGYVGLHYRL